MDKENVKQVLSTCKMSLELIAELTLPFVADRATWNNVCCANKELYLAGKNLTPPWPNAAFNSGEYVPAVAFSPSGSHLAFSTDLHVVHVWDRWGKETLLEGNTGTVYCLEYSSDGTYLASGAGDASIRVWHTESFQTTLPTLPGQEQAVKILLGGLSTAMALAFSKTDSNLLASGGLCGEVKLWNVIEQACLYTIHTRTGGILSLSFAGGESCACTIIGSSPVAQAGSIIRLWRAKGSSRFKSEIIDEAALGGHIVPPAFSPCGSFLTNVSSTPRGEKTNVKTISLYALGTMTKIRSVVVPGFVVSCFALSPDSKQLVLGDIKGRIRLVRTDDFSIQRDLDTGRGGPPSAEARVPVCLPSNNFAIADSFRTQVSIWGEVNEALMIHSKAVARQDTAGWEEQVCHKGGKDTCRIGFPWPKGDEVTGIAIDKDDWQYNCYVNAKVEKYWGGSNLVLKKKEITL